jgi:uncharacterized protein (TIGR00369 family)
VATSADDPGVRARVEGVLDIALHRFLGVALIDPAEPARGISFPVEDAALNNAGVLHGGIVTALLDVACYLALLPDLGPDENAVTHDVTASLMRPVPRGSQVQVRGSVVRRGRSIVFLRSEATVDGAVVAAGQVTKTLIRATA